MKILAVLLVLPIKKGKPGESCDPYKPGKSGKPRKTGETGKKDEPD